jgi:hypothetical protein
VTDLSKPKVFASLPAAGNATPRPPVAVAEQQLADFPIVR